MSYSRRKFLQTAGLSAATGLLATHSVLGADLFWKNNSNTLKVGLIGCGGRGTAAAVEALNADPNVILTAMGDAFSDQLEKSLQTLKEKVGTKVQVSQANQFVGLDAYQKVYFKIPRSDARVRRGYPFSSAGGGQCKSIL